MDVILEIIDTFAFDHLYALALPKRPAPYDFPTSAVNATEQTFSSWQFEPASKLFHVNPGPAAYASEWDRDNIFRQFISVTLIVWIFGLALYFIFATISYCFVFDHKTMEHPKYLKNQVSLEIRQAASSMPVMALLTCPFFLLEIRGHTKLYDTTSDGPGLWYDLLQFPFFIFATDCGVYCIHRFLHHPMVYKTLHKPHHKWIMPTPYAAYAFHPVDGWAQSLPYHIFPLLFPLNKFASALLFVIINFWTILIHDGEYMSNNPVVNGSACHTMHHLYFNYNYGQYTTLWDRIGGSYRKPDESLFDKEAKMSQSSWKKQIKETEKLVVEVEGVDDRCYEPADVKKNN